MIREFAKTSTKAVLIAWVRISYFLLCFFHFFIFSQDANSLDDVLDDLDVDDDDMQRFWLNPDQADDIDDDNLTYTLSLCSLF